MRRRLFLQVYLTLLGIVVLFGVLAALGWWLARDEHPGAELRRGLGALLTEALPAPDAPQAELDAALARLAGDIDGRVSVFGPDGKLLASLGEPLPAPKRKPAGWRTRKGRAFALPLPDGRLVLVRPDRGIPGGPAIGFLAALAFLAVAVAIGAYPLARRLARRLERLQSRVEALGAGDLATRVEVEGKDEIAALARSFNQAAERIQALVAAQRDTLAAASHELRTPLARIRMAVELLAENGDPALSARVERDVEDLDELIEEILLASRLSTLERPSAPGANRPSGARSGGGRARRRRLRGRACEGGGRRPAARPPDPQPAGECRASRTRQPRPGGGRGARRARPAPRLGPRPRRAGGGAGANLRALLSPDRQAGERLGDERGVGLGLSLVRQIARRHGGDATCRPRDGGGACFEVNLPIGDA